MELELRVFKISSINYFSLKTNKSFNHDYKISNIHIIQPLKKSWIKIRKTYGLHETSSTFASSKFSIVNLSTVIVHCAMLCTHSLASVSLSNF